MTDKERIEAIMADQHLNNVAFCNKVGLNQATLSNILADRTKPSLQVLRSIIEAFPQINSNWIFLGEGEMKKPEEDEDEEHFGPASTTPNDLFATNPNSGSQFQFGQGKPTSGSLQNHSVSQKAATDIQMAAPAISVNDIVTGVVSQLQKPTRKIIEVRIFFDDGTFETFSSK